MFRRHLELWYALVAIIALTAFYFAAYWQARELPPAFGAIGHSFGVIGFVLMLITEVLYSIRKQVTDARWGSMAGWLKFHMFTGLVGPYMVLLHTSMHFRGLAGVAMLLTVVVVGSGLVGRYIYTTIPKAAEGSASLDLEAATASSIATVQGAPDSEVPRRAGSRSALAVWYSVHVPLTWALFITALVHSAAALYYATLQR